MRRPGRLPGVAALVWVAVVSAPAAAQTTDAASTAFSVERFTPAAGAGGFLVGEDGDVLPHLDWSFSAWGSLMRRPLVLRDLITGDGASYPVDLRLGYDLSVAVGLGSRYQVALSLPVVAAQSGDRLQGIDLDERSLAPIAAGDLRIGGKARFAGAPGAPGFALAAAVGLTLPTGDEAQFAGEAGPVVEWRLIGSYRANRYRLALSLGPRFRSQRVVLLSPSRPLDNELSAAVAGEVVVPGLPSDNLSLVAEYVAVRGDRTTAGSTSRGQSPREVRFGPRWQTAAGWSITAAVGAGTSPEEIGSPAWRVMVGVRFLTAPTTDLDRDGIQDSLDLCRVRAEDRDGYRDGDGCPDPDNDGDGVTDLADECPDVAEDPDGVTDLDGCPET